eukprot:scaffold53378_cov90-Phaeocystis_antarctica.AAC.1
MAGVTCEPPEYHGIRSQPPQAVKEWTVLSMLYWGGSPRARAAATRQTPAPPPPALPPPRRPPRRPSSPCRGAARPMATAGA